MTAGTDNNVETVVIVGAGPTGLMLACELALAGARPVVLERLPEHSGQAPGMAINSTVVELLDQRGLMDPLRDESLEWPQAHFAHLFLEPTELAEPHEYTHVLPQAHLERWLEERAGALGARVLRGHEVVGLAQDGDGVTVRVRTGGTERDLRCAYVVGCDGARSAVRQLAGIDFPGTDEPFYGIVGDLATELTDEVIGHIGAHQCPGGVYTVSPFGPGGVRIATGEFDAAPPDPDAPVTVDELRESVRRLTGADPVPGTPIWLARWDNATRQADRYREGRVFVAGDAAHVHFPLGGQAMSTGIEDAVNLGWKLAAAVGGWAAPDLLDTYHAERYPVGERACLTTRAQVALMHPMARVAPLRDVFSELLRFPDVNDYLVRMAGGLDVRYRMAGQPHGDGAHPLLGRRLPAVPLNTADGPSSTAQVLRTGRGVLLDFTGRNGLDERADGWADRVDVVRAEPEPRIGACALLLRPDGRVAWVAGDRVERPEQASLGNALRAWFGAPARAAAPA
jgi:2-polyprenyl-6-methoxyphenol hydroxylase-like FAD-dependent oxidoreductase